MKRYRVGNWSEYNKSLINRGSLTVWFDQDSLQKWASTGEAKKRGRPQIYSDDAIVMLLVIREVFHLPLRALQGFAHSVFSLMGLDLQVPSYTQICRRSQKLDRKLSRLKRRGPINLIFDSSGLKIFGEGEWKVRKHGASKRRTWKKIHFAVDANSQQIICCKLSERDDGDAQVAESMLDEIQASLGTVFGDGAYDAHSFRAAVHVLGGKVLVPPPKHARYKHAKDGWERERDASLAEILGLGGDETARKLWKKLTGYHTRSLGETAFFRLKQVIGGDLKSRVRESQLTEVQCKAMALNRMSELGLPRGHWVEA